MSTQVQIQSPQVRRAVPEESVRKAPQPFNYDPRARVCVFNVSDETFYEERTHGRYPIDACQPGSPYSALIVDSTFEMMDIGDDRKSKVDFTGGSIARDIIAEHKKFGVGIAEGEWPTEKELADARARLLQTDRDLVAEADAEFAVNGNPKFVLSVARRAANRLGLTKKEWMYDLMPTDTCRFCQESIKPGAIVCKHCGRDLVETAAATEEEAVPKSKRARSRVAE